MVLCLRGKLAVFLLIMEEPGLPRERERERAPKSADCELIKSAEHKSRCQARVRPLIVQLTHLLHDSSPAFGQRVQYNTIEPQYQLYYGTSA